MSRRKTTKISSASALFPRSPHRLACACDLSRPLSSQVPRPRFLFYWLSGGSSYQKTRPLTFEGAHSVHQLSASVRASDLQAVVYARVGRRRVGLAWWICIRSYSVVVRVRWVSLLLYREDSSRFKHFWHKVREVAFDRPPEEGPWSAFIMPGVPALPSPILQLQSADQHELLSDIVAGLGLQSTNSKGNARGKVLCSWEFVATLTGMDRGCQAQSLALNGAKPTSGVGHIPTLFASFQG